MRVLAAPATFAQRAWAATKRALVTLRRFLLGIFIGASVVFPAGAEPQTKTQAKIGLSWSIVIDQFGYLPKGQKLAILRQPVVGFDRDTRYTPGSKLVLVKLGTGKVALAGRPVPWNGGTVDPSSGDRAWTFDFSAVREPGTYRVVDPERGVRSPTFRIARDVYRPVLKAATRMFFYQRAGFRKEARFGGEAWADGPSHMRPGQDLEARLFSRADDPTTARDLHGGWYDAGDYNRYTSWAANDVVELLHAYLENPTVWTDDFGIPESGNGVPDLLDEVKWELDWLTRMQNRDGSLLSILSVSHASPPSAAKGRSFYGPPNTISALAAASAFALGAKVYGRTRQFTHYGQGLGQRAQAAWAWAAAHPDVTFRNNDEAAGSMGLGAGQQETDDFGRAMARLASAVYLFDLTGENVFRAYVDTHFRDAPFMQHHAPSPSDAGVETALIYYAALPKASAFVAQEIQHVWLEGVGPKENWAATESRRDPYVAYLPHHGWGSNSVKAQQGSILLETAALTDGPSRKAFIDAASGYLHYLHGTNPLGKVYLSNMSGFGATNSVARFYHSWFQDRTPPAGYLVGGPDQDYDWDPRCPTVSPACGANPPSPPAKQPPQKSYLDFGDGWPLNSWQITEPDVGYQAAYLRLVARFVR